MYQPVVFAPFAAFHLRKAGEYLRCAYLVDEYGVVSFYNVFEDISLRLRGSCLLWLRFRLLDGLLLFRLLLPEPLRMARLRRSDAHEKHCCEGGHVFEYPFQFPFL
jgi:hypothetical protein